MGKSINIKTFGSMIVIFKRSKCYSNKNKIKLTLLQIVYNRKVLLHGEVIFVCCQYLQGCAPKAKPANVFCVHRFILKSGSSLICIQHSCCLCNMHKNMRLVRSWNMNFGQSPFAVFALWILCNTVLMLFKRPKTFISFSLVRGKLHVVLTERYKRETLFFLAHGGFVKVL